MNLIDKLLSQLRRAKAPPATGRGLAGGHSVSALQRMLHGAGQDTNTVHPLLRQNVRQPGK